MLTPSTRLTEAIDSPNLTYSIEVKKPISPKIRSTEHTKPFLANPTLSTSCATPGNGEHFFAKVDGGYSITH